MKVRVTKVTVWCNILPRFSYYFLYISCIQANVAKSASRAGKESKKCAKGGNCTFYRVYSPLILFAYIKSPNTVGKHDYQMKKCVEKHSEEMYVDIYSYMDSKGIAKKLDKSSLWMDQDGNVVASEEEAFRMPVEYDGRQIRTGRKGS
jgi:hypothetical protein